MALHSQEGEWLPWKLNTSVVGPGELDLKQPPLAAGELLLLCKMWCL